LKIPDSIKFLFKGDDSSYGKLGIEMFLN